MAKDYYHQEFLDALQNDNWDVTHDPYEIHIDGVDYAVDFGAEKLIAAQRENELVAIELKSFVGPSAVNEFHKAVGQFNDYFVALEEIEPQRTLYLAIPEVTYLTFFQRPIIQKSLKRVGVKLVVFNPERRKILSWIEL